ncbi:MAG TPA: hypothetical protein VJU77_16090 [Chthoniobacterales bacterium]|nr:hypothetical protein [Chthoniobacterales bacterium]
MSFRLRLLGVLALAICLTGSALAGDAAFSADGNLVYAIAQGDNPAVEEIDLTAKTIRTIPVAEELRGITCTSDDKLYCTTQNHFCAFDPKTGALKKIRDASPGAAFWRVAFDPKSGALFVTTDSEVSPLYRYKPPNEWKSVRMRRHPFPSCLVFAANGELFFAAYGDLWHGEIKYDFEQYSISAYRYAPLATLETENSTPAEIGVSDIGVAAETVYVHLARMGGSGDGWLAQLDRPRRNRDEHGMNRPFAPAERLPIYEAALHSLKIIEEEYHGVSIGVSPDEKRVHYVLGSKHWLATNGKAEQLELTEK